MIFWSKIMEMKNCKTCNNVIIMDGLEFNGEDFCKKNVLKPMLQNLIKKHQILYRQKFVKPVPKKLQAEVKSLKGFLQVLE